MDLKPLVDALPTDLVERVTAQTMNECAKGILLEFPGEFLATSFIATKTSIYLVKYRYTSGSDLRFGAYLPLTVETLDNLVALTRAIVVAKGEPDLEDDEDEYEPRVRAYSFPEVGGGLLSGMVFSSIRFGSTLTGAILLDWIRAAWNLYAAEIPEYLRR